MIVFPNCKINLGLHILGKRSDEYHDLETVFLPVPIHDVLELTEDRDRSKTNVVSLTLSGIPVPGTVPGNLVVVAYKILKKDFPDLPPVEFHLHKMLPAGAGLGAGSADGAFAIKALNEKFSLGLHEEQLLDYASRIGSDAPFFIINEPCFAKGRGEQLRRIPLDLSSYKLVLINPGISVSTAWAFTYIIPMKPEKSLEEVIQQPVETWRKELFNDFETLVYRRHPEIESIKHELYDKGAVYASMSGTGSTVFGLFKKDAAVSFSFPEDFFQKEVMLN